MADLPAYEAVTMGAVAILVVKEAFSMVRSTRQRNGHASPEPASVSPASAPEFALMQRQMLANDERSQKQLDRIEQMVRDVHEEALDEQVARHHRKLDLE
jgi:hypothetical protein